MSKIEVNQISSQCGSTLTIGQSGDTVTLACGATQSGFGRTGTVDWDTTAKTTNFTAANGTGYFVNTTSGAITVTLPATPSAGDIVAFKDYAGTFETNNLTVGRNGSPINGANAADPKISTAGASIFLVYVDGTRGWVATQDDSSSFSGENFIVATGGTVTTCGDYKIHSFTSPGTFTVCSVSGTPANNAADYLVVAGGGGGGQSATSDNGGGGGAGGYRESSGTATGCYTASPLGACVSAITLTATGYPITVGGGGTAGTGATSPTAVGGSGSNSVFSTITSTGGGGGGGNAPGASPPGGRGGLPGGSGGGAGGGGGINHPGGSGNTPPVSPPQGNNGSNSAPGPSPDQAGGGGGGATEAGQIAGSSAADGGRGGAGATTSISGSPTAYAGGAGTGCGAASPCGTGGAGGNGSTGGAGTTNRGGGGGGSQNTPTAGAGGSGIVIIRYKYQ